MRYYRKEFTTIDGVGAINGVFTPGAMSLRRLPLFRNQQGVSREGYFCRMMFTVKQIAPRRTVTCPAHYLGLGMA